MHIFRFSKRLVLLVALLVAAASFVIPRYFVAEAGNPHGAYYSPDHNRVLWFVHVSDTHIGTSGSTDTARLQWLVTTGRTVINPSFIVATGDLTDSTNGNIFGYPNGPYQAEWDAYRNLLDGAGAGADFYYDVPGNHDAYNDRYFAYYLANSVQGRATGSTQFSWTRSLPSGEQYHFLGVNTADNTGAPFSISFPYGDYAGLDASEIGFIEQELASHSTANLTFAFGHHPVTDTGASGDTWLFYGHTQFIHDLDTYSASAYHYGHTHEYSQALFKGNSYTGLMSGDGIAYDNVASLAKSSSDNYSLVAIDCNGVSSINATPGTWPVVLITAPLAANLGTAPNPYAYTVPAAASNPIRALVFDAAAIAHVQYRIDAGATWYPMTRVAANPALWEGTWNASALAAGAHTIEVQATGTTTRSHVISVNVTSSVNRPPVAANDSFVMTAGTTLTVNAPGVLGNDSDPDGNPLTAQLATGPSHGTLTLNTNGSFTYVPTSGYSGTDSFTYAASDGTASSSATVAITINQAPPQTDTVTITSAVYTRRTKTLAVKATSSAQPNVTLTLVGYGQMTYSAKAKAYTYSKSLATAPASSVTVTSSGGGTATKTVTVK